jgi:hypothetical protein
MFYCTCMYALLCWTHLLLMTFVSMVPVWMNTWNWVNQTMIVSCIGGSCWVQTGGASLRLFEQLSVSSGSQFYCTWLRGAVFKTFIFRKLECFKQSSDLNTLAWNSTIGPLTVFSLCVRFYLIVIVLTFRTRDVDRPLITMLSQVHHHGTHDTHMYMMNN